MRLQKQEGIITEQLKRRYATLQWWFMNKHQNNQTYKEIIVQDNP